MEIDIDVYFWMVDRGVFDDDQRNKVDIDRNKVKLHREFSTRFENAIFIAKLMIILKKSVIKISKKPFSLDPNLQNLKDNPTSIAKQTNWNLVAKELKKFGVRVDSDKKAKIIEGRFQYIWEILSKLFDFDNGGGINSQRFQDGSNSEINYVGGTGADRDNSFIGGNQSHLREDSINQSMDQPKRGEQTSILLGAPLKKAVLDPIMSNTNQNNKMPQKQSIAVTSQKKLSKVPSNQQVETTIQPNYDSLQNIDQNKDIGDAESTLEFILISLGKSLGMKPKQAAGLLSNNHKYLIHIAVKGMKGGDFTKLLTWYQDLYANTKLLLSLIEQEKETNSMANALNIVKCGLFSSNFDVCVACSRVLSKIGQDINNYTAINEGAAELNGLAWDWFISNKKDQNNQNQNEFSPFDNLNGGPSLDDVKVPDFTNQNNNNTEKDQYSEFGESGLAACVYAIKRHPNEYMEHAVSLMVQFGKFNYFELFSHQILTYFPSKSDYLTLCHDLFQALYGGDSATSLAKEVLLHSGVLDNWIDLGIRCSDFDGQNLPTERISALALLVGLWEGAQDKVEENSDVAQAILTMLKRGCRDRSKILRVASCELIFKLLHSFAVDRNPFAPILYKSLTFLLIEFHSDIQIREQMLKHFAILFTQVQSIPVSILCEPFLKQIQINDQQLTSFQFNTFDYEFFYAVVNHKRGNVSVSIQIGEEMAKVATNDIFFRNCAISIIVNIIMRFSKDPAMHSSFSQIFQQILKVIEQTERQKLQSQEQLKKKRQQQQLQPQNTNNNQTLKATMSPYKLKKQQEQDKLKQADEDQAMEAAKLACQTKERLIVHMFKKIILDLQNQKSRVGGVEMMLQDIRMQLLNQYTSIERTMKVNSRAINYLLALFGEDVPKMLQYFVEIEQPQLKLKEDEAQELYQQTIEKEFLGDNNRAGQGLDSDSLNSRDIQMMQIVPYSQETSINGGGLAGKNKWNKLQEQAMRDIDKIKSTKLERTEKKNIEDELKKLQFDKQILQAKKVVDQRKQELGVANKAQYRKNDNQQTLKGDASMTDIVIRRVRDDEGSDIDVNEQYDDQQRLFNNDDERQEMQMSIANPNNQQQTVKKFKPEQIKLYDIRMEEQKEQDAVRFFLKKNLKILKAFFTKYQNSGPLQNNNISTTFDKLQTKNTIINVAELLKFLKDYQISNIQMSKDDVTGYVRLINMDILKKHKNTATNGSKQPSSSLQVLDFEGYVEFILQLAVHLYSFNEDKSPVEYLQKLFDHFKKVAIMTGNNQSKIFEDNQQKIWGLGGSSQADAKLLLELQKRVDQNKNYKLPEGFTKVVDKEVVSNYNVPKILLETGQISESQLIVLEVLDQLIYDQYKVHFLEPMSEVKTICKVKANPKKDTADLSIIIKDDQSTALKGYVKTSLKENQASPIKSKRAGERPRRNLLSASAEAEQNSNKRTLNAKSLSQRALSPAENQKLGRGAQSGVKELKPLLGVNLKIEVAKAPQPQRALILETAYVLEEILISVEQGLSTLPDRQQLVKQKIMNRVQQERIDKESQEMRSRKESQAKLQHRKELLKNQLDKMKEEKTQKVQQMEQSKKKQREEELSKQKKKEQVKKEFFKQVAIENEKKKTTQQEELEKKKKEKEEEDKKIEEEKKQQLKVILKDKKKSIDQNLKKQIEEKKQKLSKDEENKKKKEEHLKKVHDKTSQKHVQSLQKAKELKEKQRQAFYEFMDQPGVTKLLENYEKSLQGMFDSYCKLDKPVTGKLSYKSYISMGNKAQMTPQLLASADYLYVFKTIMRAKKDFQWQQFEAQGEIDIDYESSKLDKEEFKEVLIKIACLAKQKLGGLQAKQNNTKKDINGKNQSNSNNTNKEAAELEGAEEAAVIDPESNNEQNQQEQQQQEQQQLDQEQQIQSKEQTVKLGQEYEKQFDYSDMTDKTLQALFKSIGLKVIKDHGNKNNTIQNKQNDIGEIDDEL